MTKHTLAPIVFALALAGMVSATSVSAQTNLNQRTLLTFSQPVEVPGKILPAGTYTFELNDSMANRHIVQIFDKGGSKLVALVLAVPNRRLTATGDTVVKFAEVSAGRPQVLRAWFYPGQTVGQEMVYPRTRAQQLAASSNLSVPSVDDSYYDDAKADTMTNAEVTPVTPDRVETQETTPQRTPAAAEPRKELPKTASTLPLIALFGFATLAFGLVIRRLSAPRASR